MTAIQIFKLNQFVKFRSLFLNGSVWVFALTLLVGCFKADRKAQVDGAMATFYLEEVAGSSEISQRNPQWQFPLERKYTFRVVVRDRLTRKVLPGQNFAVADESGQHFAGTTNGDGVFVWSEFVRYNYLADSGFIQLKRKMIGQGSYRGEHDFTVAINPWKQDRSLPEKEVRDQAYDKVVPTKKQDLSKGAALMGQDNDGQPDNRYLYFDRVEVATSSNYALDAKGGLNRVTLTLNPKVLVHDHLGINSYVPLKYGKFRIYPKFIVRQTIGDKTTRTLYADSNDIEEPKVTEDGVLRTTVNVRQEAMASVGQIEIALVVVPFEADQALRPFEGVCTMPGDALTIPTASCYMTEDTKQKFPHFKLADYLKGVQNFDQTKFNEGLEKTTQFDLSYLSIRFMRIKACETTVRRTLQFRPQVCVQNPRNGAASKGYRGLKFTVKRKSDLGQWEDVRWEWDKKTDRTEAGDKVTELNEACFAWVDELPHDYYHEERYVVREYKIEHAASGFSTTMQAAINPWDYGFTIGEDVRKNGLDFYKSINDETKVASQIMLYGFRFESIRYNYDIDDFLNITVKKSVLLRLDPRVIRPSSLIEGRTRNEPLRDGFFLMRYALQKDFRDQGRLNEFLDVHEKIVRVSSGLILADIEFDLSDLRLMRIRNNFLIELVPLDEDLLRSDQTCDFTLPPKLLAKDADLDKLTLPFRNVLDDKGRVVRRGSQLKTRTFVGPMIPMSIADGAGLRATDEFGPVTGCGNLYCDLQSQTEPLAEKSLDSDKQEYFTAVGQHLKNTTVIDLLKRKKQREAEYQTRMAQASSRDEFSRVFNLEAISLNTPKAEEFLQRVNQPIPLKWGLSFSLLETSNDITKPSYEAPAQKPITMTNLSQVLSSGKLTEAMALPLCIFWIKDLLPHSVGTTFDEFYHMQLVSGQLPSFDVRSEIYRIANSCVKFAQAQTLDALFSIERKLMVQKVIDHDFKHGMSMVMSLGSQFSVDHNVSRSESESFGSGVNFNPLFLMGNVFNSPLSAGAGFSWSMANSVSDSVGQQRDVKSATNLIMQTAKFQLVINDFELCATIKLQPTFVESELKPNLSKMFIKQGQFINQQAYEKYMTAVSRGILVCEGRTRTQPVKLRENYYFVAQQMNDADLIDPGDLTNHPWMIAMRGYRDYMRFISLFSHLDLSDDMVVQYSDDKVASGGSEQMHRASEVFGDVALPYVSSSNDYTMMSGERIRADAATHSAFLDQQEVSGQAGRWRHFNESLWSQEVTAKSIGMNVSPVPAQRDMSQTKRVMDYYVANVSREKVRDPKVREGYGNGDFPLQHLGQVYQGLLPTFPGVITILPDTEIIPYVKK